MKISSLIVLLCALVSVSSAYRILAVFPIKTKSHFIVIGAVLRTLARRGHQVDVVSHYPDKSPVNKNYRDVVSFQGLMPSFENNFTLTATDNLASTARGVVRFVANEYGNQICDFMAHQDFQKLVKNPPKDPPYDLVLTQAFGSNCYMGLGHVFKVPVVAIATAPEFPWISRFVGNAENLAAFPILFLTPAGPKLSFWERLKNAFEYVDLNREFSAITEEAMTAAMRKYLGPDVPGIREVENSVALTLVNTHPVMNGIKPVTPSLVQIAGLHIEENGDKLSPELKKWMDESKDGVVYYTMGSMVLIESLPKAQLLEIYATFKKISPVRVLMKIVNDTKLPPGLPGNVRTMQWIPQVPVLAHPNTKVFITHGGLGSTQEALYFGIPMLGMPLFSDQFSNIESLVRKGMAISLKLKEISEKTLGSALKSVLKNPDYKKNAVYYSKLFRDNPTSQSDKAVFWIEYVIRNGGDALKSPALQYTWYELLLLDVFVFLLLVFTSACLAIFIGLKLLLKLVGRTKEKKTSKKKVKKTQ